MDTIQTLQRQGWTIFEQMEQLHAQLKRNRNPILVKKFWELNDVLNAIDVKIKELRDGGEKRASV